MEKVEQLIDAVRTVLHGDRWNGVSGVDLLKYFLRERDESAFRELVERYGGIVLRQCRRVLQRDDLCQEAFQETFQQLVVSGHTLAWTGGLAGWLLTTAKWRALNIARRERRQAMREEMASVSDYEPDSTTQVADREAAEVVAREMALLPDRYRLPLELVYFEGKTHAEAAALLECPRGTVDSNVSRGLAKLRQVLKRAGLPSAILTATNLGQPAQAKVSAEWITETVRSVMNLAPRSVSWFAVLGGVLSGWRAALICLSLSVCLLAAALAFWPEPRNENVDPPKIQANATLEESLPDKNLRIFRTTVAPKLVASVAKLPWLDGPPEIVEESAYDSRVRCKMKCKNGIPVMGYGRYFHLAFHFDAGTRQVSVDIDPKADGQWNYVDPKRNIVLLRIEAMNYEWVLNPEWAKEAREAFELIPRDPRAEAAVKTRYQRLRQEILAYVGDWHPVDAPHEKCRIAFHEPLGLDFFRDGEQKPFVELSEEQLWRAEPGFREKQIGADGILGIHGFHLSENGQKLKSLALGMWQRRKN